MSFSDSKVSNCLFHAYSNHPTDFNIAGRDALLLNLRYRYGMHPTELSALNWSTILKVLHTKKIVPETVNLMMAVKRTHMSHFNFSLDEVEDQPVFVSYDFANLGNRLVRQSISRILNSYK